MASCALIAVSFKMCAASLLDLPTFAFRDDVAPNRTNGGTRIIRGDPHFYSCTRSGFVKGLKGGKLEDLSL